MPFCVNCGQQVQEGAKFCASCGTAVGSSQPNEGEKRKQEYAGKILKCPACGEEIPSFTAICPACGHEVNSQGVSSSIQEFIDSISECDKAIANDPEPPKEGWKSWKKGKKFWWVVLNLFTWFIPLVIYLAWPLIKPLLFPNKSPVLSANEKHKATLIENYIFPNEREATIEAMMFAKSKIAFLASEKFDKKTLYWTNLWNTKAEQLKQRADIILRNDKIVEETYTDVVSSKKKIQKKVLVRAILGVAIIIVYITLALNSGPLLRGIRNILPDNDISIGGSSQNDKSDFEWLETGLSTKVPKLDSYKGQIETNTDTELWIRLENVSYNEFEKYVSACKELGYTVEAKKGTGSYEAFDSQGYFLELYLWSSTKGAFDIELKAPLSGDPNFKWPDNELAEMLPVLDGKTGDADIDSETEIEITLYDITESDLKSYFSSCENMGFNVDVEKDNDSFEAYNSEGYKVTIHSGTMKTMSITIEKPMEFSKISWPTTGPATLLPKPSSDMANISIDFDDTFTVYISGMTIDDFNDYVDECINNGFEKSFRFDTYFSGGKGKDIDLTIQYEGYNIVYIRITNYD